MHKGVGARDQKPTVLFKSCNHLMTRTLTRYTRCYIYSASMFLSKIVLRKSKEILLKNNAVYVYWHKCAAFQRSVFGRSTAGNDVVATISISLFLFFPVFFPPSWPFLIEGVLGSKNLFSESWSELPKTWGRHLSRPRRPFWGALAAISDFALFTARLVLSFLLLNPLSTAYQK